MGFFPNFLSAVFTRQLVIKSHLYIPYGEYMSYFRSPSQCLQQVSPQIKQDGNQNCTSCLTQHLFQHTILKINVEDSNHHYTKLAPKYCIIRIPGYNESLDSDSVSSIGSLLSCSGPNQYPESFTDVNGNSVDNDFILIFHISYRKILIISPNTHTYLMEESVYTSETQAFFKWMQVIQSCYTATGLKFRQLPDMEVEDSKRQNKTHKTSFG